jgi:hypothetical protein
MVSVGIVALLLPLLALILTLGWLVVRYGVQVGRADLRRLYLYVVSFLALMIAAVTLLSAVQDAASLLLAADPSAWLPANGLQTGRLGQSWDMSRKESIANEIGPFLVATPIWLWSYRQAVQQSVARQAWTVHRFYLYAVAVVFLVTAIGFVATMVAQGLRVLLGLVDLSSQLAVRELWQGVARGLLDGGICAALWWAHYRAIPEAGAGRQTPVV